MTRADAIGVAPSDASDRTLWRIRGVQVCVVVLIAAAWQWMALATGAYFVPTIPTTFARLAEMVIDGELWRPLLLSNVSLVLGFPLGFAIGLAAGFVLGRVRWIDRAYGYTLDLAMVIPMVALVPVVIVALGLGTWARVAVVCLFTAPPVAISARAGVRLLSNNLVEMARSFGADRVQMWKTIILPSALPLIGNGTKLGLSQAVSGMVAVELIIIPAGIGGEIIESKAAFDAATVFALTLVLILEGLVLVGIASYVERRTNRRLYGEAS